MFPKMDGANQVDLGNRKNCESESGLSFRIQLDITSCKKSFLCLTSFS